MKTPPGGGTGEGGGGGHLARVMFDLLKIEGRMTSVVSQEVDYFRVMPAQMRTEQNNDFYVVFHNIVLPWGRALSGEG